MKKSVKVKKGGKVIVKRVSVKAGEKTVSKSGGASKKQAPVKKTASSGKRSSVKASPAASVKKAVKKSVVKARVQGNSTRGLTSKQLEYFKKKLLNERRRVLEEMGEIQQGNLKQSISDQSGENSRYTYHLGDVASLSYGREFSMGLAERQQRYFEQIEEALQRIEDGVYGICKVTGETIPVERLEEVPVAKYSVKGKELLEQRKRQGLG